MVLRRKKIKLFIDRALVDSFWRQIGVLAAILVAALILSYFFLAFSGSDWRGFCGKNNLRPWLLPVYLLIDSNALNALYLGNVHGWMLIACSITYLIGLFIFNGMIIGIITNAIEHRVAQYRNGLLHYLRSGHYVIMGYDEMVPSIINDIYSKPENKEVDILLLTSRDAKTIHEKLLKSVAKDKMEHVFVTYGHRTSKDYYKDICLEHSKEIFIVGKRDHPAHDAVNVECAENVFTYLKENKTTDGPKCLTCVLEDLDTYAAFKTTEIFKEYTENLDIDFLPYNFYTGWARQVFVTRTYREKMNAALESYPSVYEKALGDCDKIGQIRDRYVHLVFVGTSNFSVAFAMEAAHLLHFPNFERDNSLKTRITFIDLNADEELRLFTTRNRYFFEIQPYYYMDATAEQKRVRLEMSGRPYRMVPHFHRMISRKKTELLSRELSKVGFLDIEFEFIKGDVFSSNVQGIIKEWASDEQQCLSLFFAMADQRKNFVIGMNMPDEVYSNGIPVFIRQNRADDFVTSLRKADDRECDYYYVDNKMLNKACRKGRYAHIYPFGMEDMAYFSDNRALRQAKLINYLYFKSENNRFPDKLELDNISKEILWRDVVNFWKKISVAEKWSNLYAAYSMACKFDLLRSMRELDKDDHSRDCDTLSYAEEELLAKVEHNRWNVEKLLMGYRKAHEEEDRYNYPAFSEDFKKNKKKLFIHSDIRPFEDLDDIRQMDYEIVKYIPWILKMTSNE